MKPRRLDQRPRFGLDLCGVDIRTSGQHCFISRSVKNAGYCSKDKLGGKEKSQAGTGREGFSPQNNIQAGKVNISGNFTLQQTTFKDLDNRRVKLATGKLFHDFQHRVGGHPFPVGPVGGHGIE